MPKIRCHRCTVVELWKLYRKSKSQLCSFIRVMELKITPRHDPTINRGLESDFSNQFVFCASLVENRNTALSLGQQDNCVGDICPAIDFLIKPNQNFATNATLIFSSREKQSMLGGIRPCLRGSSANGTVRIHVHWMISPSRELCDDLISQPPYHWLVRYVKVLGKKRCS